MIPKGKCMCLNPHCPDRFKILDEKDAYYYFAGDKLGELLTENQAKREEQTAAGLDGAEKIGFGKGFAGTADSVRRKEEKSGVDSLGKLLKTGYRFRLRDLLKNETVTVYDSKDKSRSALIRKNGMIRSYESFSILAVTENFTREYNISSTDRACPTCGVAFPEFMGNAPVYVLSLYGATNAGKTTLISSVLRINTQRVAGHNIDFNGHVGNEELYNSMLVKDTATGANTPWYKRTVMMRLKKGEKTYGVIIRDIAGDVLAENAASNARADNNTGETVDQRAELESLGKELDGLLIVRDFFSVDRIVARYNAIPDEILKEEILAGLNTLVVRGNNAIDDREKKKSEFFVAHRTMRSLGAILSNRMENSSHKRPLAVYYALNKGDLFKELAARENRSQYGGVFDFSGASTEDAGMDRTACQRAVRVAENSPMFDRRDHFRFFDRKAYVRGAIDTFNFLERTDDDFNHILGRNGFGKKIMFGVSSISAVPNDGSFIEPLAWLVDCMIGYDEEKKRLYTKSLHDQFVAINSAT